MGGQHDVTHQGKQNLQIYYGGFVPEWNLPPFQRCQPERPE